MYNFPVILSHLDQKCFSLLELKKNGKKFEKHEHFCLFYFYVFGDFQSFWTKKKCPTGISNKKPSQNFEKILKNFVYFYS